MAAAARLHTAGSEDRLALALRYPLLTDRTSLVVVHERAEAERASALPALHRVPQMLAAGWGGSGSVAWSASSAVLCERSDVCFDYASLPPFPLRKEHFVVARAHAIRRLDGTGGPFSPDRLPASLEELRRAGVPGAIVDQLVTLVGDGNAECDVVRACLEALAEWARQCGATQAPVGQLTGQFGDDIEHAAMRQRARDRHGVGVRGGDGAGGFMSRWHTPPSARASNDRRWGRDAARRCP